MVNKKLLQDTQSVRNLLLTYEVSQPFYVAKTNVFFFSQEFIHSPHDLGEGDYNPISRDPDQPTSLTMMAFFA